MNEEDFRRLLVTEVQAMLAILDAVQAQLKNADGDTLGSMRKDRIEAQLAVVDRELKTLFRMVRGETAGHLGSTGTGGGDD